MPAPKLSSEIINQFMKNVDEMLGWLPHLKNQCQLRLKAKRNRFDTLIKVKFIHLINNGSGPIEETSVWT